MAWPSWWNSSRIKPRIPRRDDGGRPVLAVEGVFRDAAEIVGRRGPARQRVIGVVEREGREQVGDGRSRE